MTYRPVKRMDPIELADSAAHRVRQDGKVTCSRVKRHEVLTRKECALRWIAEAHPPCCECAVGQTRTKYLEGPNG